MEFRLQKRIYQHASCHILSPLVLFASQKYTKGLKNALERIYYSLSPSLYSNQETKSCFSYKIHILSSIRNLPCFHSNQHGCHTIFLLFPLKEHYGIKSFYALMELDEENVKQIICGHKLFFSKDCHEVLTSSLNNR